MADFDRYFKAYDYRIDWKYVDTIPEFDRLKECEQNPVWHAEGNAYIHTKKAVEAAEKLILDSRFQNLNPKVAMLAVLFHDIGKGVTTEFKNGNWHAYGHENAGERIARRMLWDYDFYEREIICSCIRNHMRILRFADSKNILKDMVLASGEYAFRWDYQLFVKMCDNMACEMQDEREYVKDMTKLETLYELAHHLMILDCKFHLNTTLADKLVFGKKKVDWLNPVKDDRPTVYVLIGLPGAGKSTLIENSNVCKLSRDEIRAELGYCNYGDKVVLTGEMEDEVTRVLNERLLEHIKNGEDVYLDNINLKKKYRMAIHQLLKDFDVRYEYVYVEAPALKFNIERRPTFNPGIIETMTEVLDWPTMDEYDDLSVYKFNIYSSNRRF